VLCYSTIRKIWCVNKMFEGKMPVDKMPRCSETECPLPKQFFLFPKWLYLFITGKFLYPLISFQNGSTCLYLHRTTQPDYHVTELLYLFIIKQNSSTCLSLKIDILVNHNTKQLYLFITDPFKIFVYVLQKVFGLFRRLVQRVRM
jgi:hypothetical protein